MIKLMILFVLVFFIQENNKIIVSSSVDKNVLKIGDKIHYKISIDYDSKLKIESPGQGINLGYFEIQDFKILNPRTEGNRVIEEFEYTISTFDTGHYNIPPFPVAYFEKNDKSDFNYIEAPEQQLWVKSVFLNDSVINEQPRDIKKEKEIVNKLDWWLIGSILFLLILLMIGVLIYIKSKQKPLPEKIISPLLAHEIAMIALDKWQNFNSSDAQEINYYYTELSMILRSYLENRFNIIAVEATTTELKVNLQAISISTKQYDTVIENVAQADLVKFAKNLPNENDFKRTYMEIIGFVQETKMLAKVGEQV